MARRRSARRLSTRRRISSWAYLPLAVPLAILAGVVVFANVKPAPAAGATPPGARGSLVWGDGIFAKRVEVKAWLGIHGASYRRWAPHHPAALRLLPLKARATHAATAR
jgi:hypothetical protein